MDSVTWKNGQSEEHDGDAIQVVKPRLDADAIIREITKDGDQDEPFYVCDINEIVRRHEDWTATMPRVTTHYAVKCNDSKVVLEVMVALGAGFDCASKEEIRKVLSLGVQPDRIIFAHTVKKISHLKYAADVGVTMMTFDSEFELHKIKRIYPTAELIIRIKFDDPTAKYVLGEMFGCDHVTEAPRLLRTALSLGLNVMGVCFHIGSQSNDPSIYRRAIVAARHVYDEAAQLGYKLQLLDIGGGFPGEKQKSIKEIGKVINAALEEYFPDLSVKVTSEPGRYYVTSAFTMASNIHSVRDIVKTDSATRKQMNIRMYYMDVGIFGAFLATLVDWYFVVRPLDVRTKSDLLPSIVCGPSPNSFDRMSDGAVLMPEMEAGDWVVVENAGAYTLTLACEFSRYPTPKIHSFVDEDGRLKLTSKVAYPMSRERFVIGNKSEHFKIGLTGPNRFRTNYI